MIVHRPRRMPGERLIDARGPVHQLAAAIRAAIVERLCALRAEGAFERADKSACLVGRKIGAAAFAVGAHFEHGVLLAGVWCGVTPGVGFAAR